MENESGAFADQDGVKSENQETLKEPSKPSASASQSDHEKYKRDMLKYKDEVAKLREQLSAYETEREEQKGNLQKVIEKLKSENKEIKSKYSQERLSFAMSKVEETVKAQCALAGCKDPETFFRLIDKEDINALQVDEKYNIDKKEAKDLVEKYSKKYEHLGFFDRKVNIVDKAPANNSNFKGGEKSMADMTKDELVAHAKKMGFKTLK
jgi:hypothetical protein